MQQKSSLLSSAVVGVVGWVLAVTVGGWIDSQITSSDFVGSGVMGLMLGATHFTIVRRYVASAVWWVLPYGLAWAAAWYFGFEAPLGLFGRPSPFFFFDENAWSGFAGIGTAAAAFLQLSPLRRRLRAASLIGVASAIAAYAGLVVGLMIDSKWSNWEVVGGAAAAGLLLGLLTSTALRWSVKN